MHSLPSSVARFCKAQNGNIAIVLALSIMTIMAAAGAAIDFGRYYLRQTKLQTITDGALLAATMHAKEVSGSTKADLLKIAKDYINSNVPSDIDLASVDLDITTGDSGSKTFSIDLQGIQPTTFMYLFGQKTMIHDVRAQSVFGAGRPVELALALDVTGSMSGSKLATLKTSATNLANTLLKDNSAGTAKMAIVPFANYVNVGTDKRGQPWLDVKDDYSTTKYVCSTVTPVISKSNCVKKTTTCYNDGVPYSCTSTTCDYVYGTPYQSCGNQTTNYKWTGCVGSRSYPLSLREGSFDTSKVPGLLNTSCPPAITALTSSYSTITAGINALTASGETYIATGLTWGMYALSHDDPYSEGMTKADAATKQAVKAIVLMTDGANTRSPKYPYHNGTDGTLSNKLLAEACEVAKAEGMTLYTIAFQIDDKTTQDMLQACATSTDNYFDAGNEEALEAAFEEIGKSLSVVRLSK
ncbi:pilus assembly protein TadG-related protein [Aestuariivirga sp.]|uniref:TadE/TadG family type IV pilus assembly protein n=1 Tax=Aestuariivirga sp. TaxID=2650926 RepID=UPI0039E6D3AC